MCFLAITPPPLIFGLGFVAGLAVDFFYSPGLLPDPLSLWTGWFLILLSITIVLPVLLRFRRADTPFDVQKKPVALVTTGPFRYSRNPAYVSLSMLYLGVGVLLDSLPILVLFIVCFIIVDRVVIAHEEEMLEAEFGDRYRDYKVSVRRWI